MADTFAYDIGYNIGYFFGYYWKEITMITIPIIGITAWRIIKRPKTQIKKH